MSEIIIYGDLSVKQLASIADSLYNDDYDGDTHSIVTGETSINEIISFFEKDKCELWFQHYDRDSISCLCDVFIQYNFSFIFHESASAEVDSWIKYYESGKLIKEGFSEQDGQSLLFESSYLFDIDELLKKGSIEEARKIIHDLSPPIMPPINLTDIDTLKGLSEEQKQRRFQASNLNQILDDILIQSRLEMEDSEQSITFI